MLTPSILTHAICPMPKRVVRMRALVWVVAF